MAAGRPRRLNSGCIRAACLFLTVAGLLFLVLASIKAGRQSRATALPEDLGSLANIFVCITFAWQVDKLGFLQLVRPCPAPQSARFPATARKWDRPFPALVSLIDPLQPLQLRLRHCARHN